MKEACKWKILLAGHGASLGGGDRYLFDQAVILSDQGYYVNCVAFEGGPLETAYEEKNILFRVEPAFLLTKQKIYDLIADFDIVIANTMYAIFFAYEAQKYKPVMLILHDCPSYMQNLFVRTSLSEWQLTQIRHLYGVSPYHVVGLNNMGRVHAKLINNFVEDTCSAERNVCGHKKIRFLTVANWSDVKGYDLALNAFNYLQDDEKNMLEWHIAGKMENDRNCSRFQENAKQESWIYFHGALADKQQLHELYQSCDIYLQMSREDSCPLAVIDAAMLHMPLLVSKDTGSNYLANDGAGWVVDEYDSKSIANVVREILNSKNQLSEAGEQARKNYLAYATPEIYKRVLTREIQAVIQEDRKILKACDVNETHIFDLNEQAVAENDLSDKRVVLYGFNMFAQIEIFYCTQEACYNLVGIFDSSYDKYKEQGPDIRNPKELTVATYDYICICCVYDSTVDTIRKYLMEMGIPLEKIRVGVKG